MSMKKILLPTDFSENARHTIEYTARLFENEAIEYVLFHAYDLPPAPALVTSTKLLANIKKDSEEELQQEYDHLSALLKGTGSILSSAVKRGSVIDIINSKKYKDAYLVAIGSQGKGSTVEYRIGSNTLNIMKNVDTPVLVIPKGLKYSPIHKIVYGADLSGLSDNAILDPVVDLMAKNDVILEITHISDEPNPEKKKRMDELISYFGEDRVRSKYLKESKVSQGFEGLINETNPDLLIMVNRRKSFFTRIFYPSVTKKMILRTSLPILVLHDK